MNPYEAPLDFKIDKAIKTLQAYESFAGDNGYQLCFSGGKDSVVIKHLADMSGVKYHSVYALTTIDPPELVRFIKKEHPDVVFSKYKENGKQVNFFKKIESKGFPTRRCRWCCDVYKHNTGFEKYKILGIRAEESPRRKAQWKVLTRWQNGEQFCVNPILYWTEKDVWNFIKSESIPYCSLYDEGFTRLGCIGCPMAGKKGRLKEFKRWPRYEMLWRRAFQRLWDKRANSKQRDGREWFGSAKFKNAEQLFNWWLSDKSLPPSMDLEDFFGYDEFDSIYDDEDNEVCTMGMH